MTFFVPINSVLLKLNLTKHSELYYLFLFDDSSGNVLTPYAKTSGIIVSLAAFVQKKKNPDNILNN